MEKLFKEKTVKVAAGTKFRWKDSYSDWEAELTVDENGNPTYASYGSMNGWCSRSPEDGGFDDAVRRVMETLLEKDVEEFKNMRDSLNNKYRNMAEDVRIGKASKYNF